MLAKSNDLIKSLQQHNVKLDDNMRVLKEVAVPRLHQEQEQKLHEVSERIEGLDVRISNCISLESVQETLVKFE